MKFNIFIIIPSEIEVSKYEQYVETILAPYYSELEVTPYTDIFWDKKRTKELSIKHNCTIDELLLQPNLLQEDDWIEDGQICYMSTYNIAGKWDYYFINEYVLMTDLTYVAAAFIDLDCIWHDIDEFGYKMRLDKYIDGERIAHPDNKKALELFDIKFKTYYNRHKSNMIAILSAHD